MEMIMEEHNNKLDKPKKKKRERSTKKLKSAPFDNQLIWVTELFLNDLECAKDMFTTITPVLKEKDEKRKKKIEESLVNLKSLSKNDNIDKEKTVSKIRNLMKEINQLSRANLMFRCNSIVLLVSRFDEFIANILRIYFKAFPNQLKNPDKTITYDEIVELNSVDQILDTFISKEIDRTLREGHCEQIEFLDKNLKLGIIENFDKLIDFIEITERRNLIVHNGGIVNKHYIQICKNKNIPINNKIKIGDILSVNDEYFEKSFHCFFELGLRIGQSSVRRLFPECLDNADTSLINEIGFPILQSEDWELAKVIFHFAKNIPRKLISDERSHRIYIINLCICLKHLKQNKSMLELLDSFDWSSSSNEFKLAVYILKEEYSEAENLMVSFNEEDPFSEHVYRTWPLFLEFRRTENFSRAFKKIYNKEFEPKITEEESEALKLS